VPPAWLTPTAAPAGTGSARAGSAPRSSP
jgi:hypothetical protein